MICNDHARGTKLRNFVNKSEDNSFGGGSESVIVLLVLVFSNA